MTALNKTAYKTLAKLIEGLEINQSRKIDNASGIFMPVSVEVLEVKNSIKRVAISHYYEQNGDLMADPDMEFLVMESIGFAQAVTYKQDGLGIYQVARWIDENGRELCRPGLLRDINHFACQWMRNIRQQQGL